MDDQTDYDDSGYNAARTQMRQQRERKRRAKRRRTTFFVTCAVVVALLVVAILLGPWGPLKGAVWEEGKKASRPDLKTTPAVTPTSAAATTPTTPTAPAAAPVTYTARPNSLSKINVVLLAQLDRLHFTKRSDTRPPTIAIVVDDTGSFPEKLPLWTSIDAPLSFTVIPYTDSNNKIANELHKAGFQIMMHIPTSNAPPNSFSGKGQLEPGMSKQTVFSTLDTDLAQVPFVGGINNHQGGRGCDDLALMTSEVEWAKSKGFYVVDSNSSVKSQVTPACKALGLPKRLNEVFIDHQNDVPYIQGAMRELAALARKNGTAIGICHYHRPNTPSTVGEMIKTLRAEGIHFAFVKDITD